jgi:hypothetical protein
MLDECKGDKLEDVLAVFSNAVLKKCLQNGSNEPIAQQLALENFSYTGERTVLFVLALVHKSSLKQVLREKGEARARYKDFSDLLNINDRRIVRRHEQLKQIVEERNAQDELSQDEVERLQQAVQKNWSGSDGWLETMLYGDSLLRKESLLGSRFDTVWKHVENGSICEVEAKKEIGLLKHLDSRIKDQEARLARWRNFGKTLSKTSVPLPNEETPALEQRIDIGFNRHLELQVRNSSSKTVQPKGNASLDEYMRLIQNMKAELEDVGKPQVGNKPPRESVSKESPTLSPSSPARALRATAFSPVPSDLPTREEWPSTSEIEQSAGLDSYAAKPTSQTSPSEAPYEAPAPRNKYSKSEYFDEETPKARSPEWSSTAPRAVTQDNRPQSSRPSVPPRNELTRTPPPITTSHQNPGISSETDSIADQILNSIAASSPSPKKTRHTLSLAERTRLSMSRTTHYQFSDVHDTVSDLNSLPKVSLRHKSQALPIRQMGSASTPEQEDGQEDHENAKETHADLISRTRKSMAGFEAAQKKAQLDRRRSIRDQKKKARESSFFPRLDEESVGYGDGDGAAGKKELLEGDPDYESVFMSRPKIKTSPATSPTRAVDWQAD